MDQNFSRTAFLKSGKNPLSDVSSEKKKKLPKLLASMVVCLSTDLKLIIDILTY